MATRSISYGMALAVVTFLPTAVGAIFADVDQQFVQSQRKNAEELRQYTWKSRTEIRRGREIKSVQLALMRYDIYGALQKTPITATAQPQLPARGLRGRIAQKMKDEFVDTLQNLEALARSYGELPPEAMQRFIATASVAPDVGLQQTALRLSGQDVRRPGDSMSIWMDRSTRRMRKVDIHAALDGKPVRVVSDYRDLPDGPTYLARSAIDYPSEALTVVAENFDYQRVAR